MQGRVLERAFSNEISALSNLADASARFKKLVRLSRKRAAIAYVEPYAKAIVRGIAAIVACGTNDAGERNRLISTLTINVEDLQELAAEQAVHRCSVLKTCGKCITAINMLRGIV